MGAVAMAALAAYGGATALEIVAFSSGAAFVFAVLGLIHGGAPTEPPGSPSDADRMGNLMGALLRFVSGWRGRW